jgi:tRNA pseudouridine32 synthase / 23S rRNA pseudouridine746 synthase
VNFRPLRRADYPLLQRWLAAPHVAPWWRLPYDAASLETHYGPRIDGREPTFVFVIEINDSPAGWIQWYRWVDYPEHAARIGAAVEDAGMDLALGEFAMLGRGLGPQAIHDFLHAVVWPHAAIAACVVDPEASNERSIRAFAKAGFLPHSRAAERTIFRLARHGPTALQHWGENAAEVPIAASPLERTPLAQRIARQLLRRTPRSAEGKMLGVMIVETAAGAAVLQAFSGLLAGSAYQPGWVPPLSVPTPVPGEAETVARLSEIRTKLEALAASSVWAELERAEALWNKQDVELAARQRENKLQREEQRREGAARGPLDALGLAASNEKRSFRRRMRAALQPLREQAARLQAQVESLKSERRALSRALQSEMHARFSLPLSSLFPNGPPTGVGECCAPKLLHYAVLNGFVPRGLAEIWHGPSSPGGGRHEGEFYEACAERCQPLLGPMLAAIQPALVVLYEDDSLVAVDKPPGLLTVPGRRSWNQDSLLTRVQARYPEALPVHRLDLETSGVVVFARSREVQASLQQQFARRTVRKVYQALLEAPPALASGEIVLPLARDGSRPGCYHAASPGLPAVTRFRRLEANRVELTPLTGRSHQLRVHAASGLHQAIVGDPLYGTPGARMCLHACLLEVIHPATGELLSVRSKPPF